MLNQPEMLEKARTEIDSVVGNNTTLLQESHILQLPYIIACAREALRLHPVTAFNVPHVSTSDSTVAGYFIPKGSNVLLSRVGLGRNHTVWDQPLRFNPDRHLDEKHCDLGETDLRFISFTTGRRGCIRVELGTNMTVMLLGRLLQGFTWKIPHGMEKIDLSTEEGNSMFKETDLDSGWRWAWSEHGALGLDFSATQAVGTCYRVDQDSLATTIADNRYGTVHYCSSTSTSPFGKTSVILTKERLVEMDPVQQHLMYEAR
ncbi:hypothetical protein F8388_000594 [Cannabis sativa]|uniref:Cytochrome P450 n=1 Tax=Cannabis sativa TaxID=3483 RepID=A0A7J6EEL7_CANSA|nr:hypothetical protein F8388_000594 [Cannabis sativa]